MANRGDCVVQPDVAREWVHSDGVRRNSEELDGGLLSLLSITEAVVFPQKKATVSGGSWISIAKTHDVLS